MGAPPTRGESAEAADAQDAAEDSKPAPVLSGIGGCSSAISNGPSNDEGGRGISGGEVGGGISNTGFVKCGAWDTSADGEGGRRAVTLGVAGNGKCCHWRALTCEAPERDAEAGRGGGPSARGQKAPMAMGRRARRNNSQPPFSALRSSSGEGRRARYTKPGGGSSRSAKPASKQHRLQSVSSSASAQAARRSGKGPTLVPSKRTSAVVAPMHTKEPVTGRAPAGT